MYQPTTAFWKITKLQKPVNIVQGSQGAGKTVGIEMNMMNTCIWTPGQEMTIIQAELSKLKKTAMLDFLKILKSHDNWNPQWWNKTESTYRFPNGSFIEFIGLDKADVGKGFRRDVVFFNELNKGNVTLDTFIQFSARAKMTYADYNPDRSFWLHDDIISDKDTDFLILTYKDNEYLPKHELKQILKYKEKGFKNPDAKDLFNEDNIKSKYWANKWRVYGLGQTGLLEGAVFENWEYGTFNPNRLQTSCGLDLGFSVSKDALVEVAIDKKRKIIYLKQHIYKLGLKTDDLATLIKDRVDDKLVVSEVDPRLIADMKHRGITIRQHKKGKIETGVTMMLDYLIIVDPDSVDLGKELTNYVYADKGSKLYVDEWNHLIDAARYNIEFHLRNPNRGNYMVV